MIDQKPYFVGKDIAEVLGYSDSSSAVSKCADEEDKTTLLLRQDGSNYKSKTKKFNLKGRKVMKKLLSVKDESKMEESVLGLLISKKCTLSDFDQLVDKIHQYYRDNATLADLKVVAKINS